MKSEKSTEFVDDIIDPLHGTEVLSSIATGSSSDDRLSKNSTQGKSKSRRSSNNDEERSRDSLLNESRARSNSKSDDERSKASSRKSRSRSRSSSSSSNERSKASSRKSRSRSRSNSSSSSERSKAGSQKSRSRSRSSSSSSNERSKATSRKSRSRSRSSSSSSSGRSKAGSQKSRSRSRSSSSSSSKRSKASSKKSRSRSRSRSSSDDNRSKASSRKSRSRSRSSSSSDDRSKVNTRKSRSRSTSKSDDQSKASSKKSRARSSSSSDDEQLKETLRNQSLNAENTTLTETVNQSNKSDDSDNETLSINKRTSRIIDSESDSDISKSKQPTPSNDAPTVQKSSGKFSLITASDLESEDDRIPMNGSSSENDSISKSKKKSKKLQKKKSSKKSSVLKSNGIPESMNSESENEEGNTSKRPRKSIPKLKKEKKEKDPLMSIRSETQRMIREGRISLPYHQPKQHTLLEFLQRRKAAPSMPLRASADEMKNVCERLTIKEKEAEEFFKSESEHSDDETKNTAQAPSLNQDTAMDVETSADFSLETATKVSESIETNIAPETTENQNTAINLEPSVDCTLENIPKATESIEIDSLPNNDSSENASSEHESMDTSTLPENSTQLIDTDTNSVQEETSSSNPLESNEGTCNEKASPDESKPTENIIATSNEMSIDVPHETIESSSSLSESNARDSKSDEPIVTENIPDSVDFELQIQDSCNDTETPPNKSAPLDIQPDNSTGSKPSTEDDFPPVASAPKKNSAKSRLERTLALLSSHNIDLQPVNLSDFSEDMQFEIPQYNDHFMANGKLKKNNSQFDVLGTQKSYGGVWELKEKFVKHSMTKSKPTKSSSQINVVSTQKDAEGEITGVTKETLVLTLDDPESEFSDPKFSKPGAKHAYLKEKMLKTLISKKEAYWNEYQTEKQKMYGSDSEEEKNDDDETCSTKKLDFEPYHPEDELDDEELIEDDIIIKEKDRKKNCFLDEEAEVSDLEEMDENADEFGEDDDEVDENADESIHEDKEENEENDLLRDEDTKESDDDLSQSMSKRSDERESNDDSINRSLFKYNTTGTELENKVLGLESMSQIDESEDFTDSQIFGICSGKFTSQMSPSKPNTDSDFFADSQNVEDSQNICLSLPEPKEHTQNMINNRDQLFESDGSDNEELFARKKRAMRIEDSDDESEIPAPIGDDKDENFEAEDQEEDFENDEAVEDDDDDNIADIEAEEYGYNSDEELVPVKSKVAEEFFENEAELSESEWGSEDENERDLDKFEKEEGDDDELDNDKLKEELGKIHMRQLLDDDQHDVRMLKEMLLEDGELHSDAKRQRKFQWKNLDGDDFFLKNNNDSDDENALRDDDETEEHWRKIRHERETFLSQQEEKPCLNELENVESTFIQLPGKKKIVNESITRVQQDVANSASGMTNSKTSPRPNSGLDSKFKCGSFLSRGKFLLSKIALSVSDTKERVGGAKNGRNFVFGTISPEKKSTSVAIEKTEKRKICNGSVSISKRVKFSLENGPNGSKRESLLAQLALSD